MTRSFKIDWYPGSSAVFEISAPSGKDTNGVVMRFVPPLRGTLRLPVSTPGFTKDDLEAIIPPLVQQIFGRPPAGSPRRNSTPAPGLTPAGPPVDELGKALCQAALPRQVEVELSSEGLFLEIVTDEAYQDYPWELMHDGTDFYCLRHYIGRFVNVSKVFATPGLAVGNAANILGPFSPLRVLLICVDEPPPVGMHKFRRLTNAYGELTALAETLPLAGVAVKPLFGTSANHAAVREALTAGDCQVIHFIGHSHYDEAEPRKGGLVLSDELMTCMNVYQFLSRKTRPVLCFINGCESSSSLGDKVDFGQFGLGRAILESGAYLLGSRWKVSDVCAKTFALAFYDALLKQGLPIGQAVTKARLVCKDTHPNDPAWASYAYYGDPRVCFRGC
jgi:CHAT domain-containing protein